MTINNEKNQVMKKGYSLIEILIYMALLGIFLFGLTQLFVSSLDLNIESEANSSVEQDGRFILSRFRYDFLQASSINSPGSHGASGILLQLTASGVNYTYAVADGNLTVSDGVNSYQLNSSRSLVSDINFLRLGNIGGKNTITVSFTLTSIAAQVKGPETRTYNLTFGIR